MQITYFANFNQLKLNHILIAHGIKSYSNLHCDTILVTKLWPFKLLQIEQIISTLSAFCIFQFLLAVHYKSRKFWVDTSFNDFHIENGFYGFEV